MAERIRLIMQPIEDMLAVELGTGSRLPSDDPLHIEVATTASEAMDECTEKAGGTTDATILPFRKNGPIEQGSGDGEPPA